MACSELCFRHIIDLDGQLAGIEEAVIDAASLLVQAGRKAGAPLYLIKAGSRTLIGPQDLVRLSEEEVLFFETCAAPVWQPIPSTPFGQPFV